MAKPKKPKCNKKNVRSWVAALRSGKYRKVTGALRSGNRYCCLGVACAISDLGEFNLNGGYVTRKDGVRYDTLPPSVRTWLGLESSNPMLPNQKSGELESAATLNDEERHSFRMIADAIEERYL